MRAEGPHEDAGHAIHVDARRRRRVACVLVALIALGVVAGLLTGPGGLSPGAFLDDLRGPDAALLMGQIRAPRSVGAALVGALLGISGAVAQGLFRNPLADPYLLGSAAGAGLGVILVLAASTLSMLTPFATGLAPQALAWLQGTGLVLAAFAGALAGTTLTLTLARGAVQTLRLLLAGVVVGVVLGAAGDLVTVLSPDALRGRQAFMLGSTGFIGWGAVLMMGSGFVLVAWLAHRLSAGLDALTLGEDSAGSLGIAVPQLRLVLVAAMSLATALAVSQAGLVAFVGLVSPHLARRLARGTHAWVLMASAGTGAALLLVSDLIARSLIAPQELPVGVVTALLGGAYLFRLLYRRAGP